VLVTHRRGEARGSLAILTTSVGNANTCVYELIAGLDAVHHDCTFSEHSASQRREYVGTRGECQWLVLEIIAGMHSSSKRPSNIAEMNTSLRIDNQDTPISRSFSTIQACSSSGSSRFVGDNRGIASGLISEEPSRDL
jgi:hypothetical protein